MISKIKEVKMIKVIEVVALLGTLLLMSGCSWVDNLLENYKHDNFVEEIVEDIIENETGLDIDLSFTSPENPDKEDGKK